MRVRRSWTYRGCSISPKSGESRYFGSHIWFEGCVQYRTEWWKVVFPDGTWSLCGTKGDARRYINSPRNERRIDGEFHDWNKPGWRNK